MKTTPAPHNVPADAFPLAPGRLPLDASILPPARVATCLPDCDECLNTGRYVVGVYGGHVEYAYGCPECGREGEA
jgi:hypothetical protein